MCAVEYEKNYLVLIVLVHEWKKIVNNCAELPPNSNNE